MTRTLTDAFTLVDLFQAEVDITEEPETATTTDAVEAARARDDICRHLQALPQNPLDSVPGRLAEATKITAWMHFRAVAGKAPHRRHAANAIDCAYLREVLRNTSLQDWMGMPYAYLWVYAASLILLVLLFLSDIL